MLSEVRGKFFRRKDGKNLMYLPKDFTKDGILLFDKDKLLFVNRPAEQTCEDCFTKVKPLFYCSKCLKIICSTCRDTTAGTCFECSTRRYLDKFADN